MFGYILIDIVSNDSPQASRAGRASRAGDALEAAHSSLDEILDQKHTQCLHTFDPFHLPYPDIVYTKSLQTLRIHFRLPLKIRIRLRFK